MSRQRHYESLLDGLRADLTCEVEQRKAEAIAKIDETYAPRFAALDLLLGDASDRSHEPEARTAVAKQRKRKYDHKLTKRGKRYNNGHKPTTRDTVVPLLVAAVKKGYTTPRQIRPQVRIDGHLLTRAAVLKHLRHAVAEKRLVRLVRGRYGLPPVRSTSARPAKADPVRLYGNKYGCDPRTAKIERDLVALARDGARRATLIDLITHDYGVTSHAVTDLLHKMVESGKLVRVEKGTYADPKRR